MLDFPNDLPLTGVYRLPLMLIDIGIVLVSLDVAAIYMKKSLMSKNSLKSTRIHAAWISLFLGYAGMEFWYWLADFYTNSVIERYHLNQFGYFCAATGAFFYIYYVEQLAFVSKRRIFTMMFSVLYAILIILIFIAFFIDIGTIVQYFVASFWIPNIGLLSRYLFMISKYSKGTIHATPVMVGLIVLILGILGSTDVMFRALGWPIRFLGDSFQILGTIMIALFSSSLPTWKELEWKNELDSLYVIYKGGTLAYEYDFGEGMFGFNAQQSAVVVSVLEASRMLLNSALKTGELKILDFKEKKIYFEPGEFITILIVAKTELDTINFLIKKIRKEFEKSFRDILPNWDGESDVFYPATSIIGKILS